MNSELKDRWIFPGPLLILPGFIVAWPLLQVFLMSFKNQVILFGIDRWVGFANYEFLLGKDLRFYVSLFNTCYFTLLSVGLEFLFGLLFALYLRFQTGSLWLKAISFTALAFELLPRPAGRSGWVRTARMHKPASSRPSSISAANSGVPANTTWRLSLERIRGGDPNRRSQAAA